MAIIPETAFPGKIIPSSSAYPYGEARDVTTPGDGTGTPWVSLLLNDLFGFQQAILAQADIVPSGASDTAEASQYLEAIKALVGTPINDMLGLVSIPLAERKNAKMLGFFVTSPQAEFNSSGTFVWQADLDKVNANGGTIVDPDNLGGFDGTISTRDAFLAAQGGGVGLGCWVLQYAGRVNVMWFGAGANGTDDVPAFEAAATVGEVYAPAGTYSLSTLATTAIGLKIHGDGQRKTVLDFELVAATGGTDIGLDLGFVVGVGGNKQIVISDLTITDSRATSECDILVQLQSGPIFQSPSETSTMVTFNNVFIEEHNLDTATTFLIDSVSHLTFNQVRAGFEIGSKYALHITDTTGINTGVLNFMECYFSAKETALFIEGGINLLDSINFVGCGMFATQVGAAEVVIIDGTSVAVSAVNFIGNHLESRNEPGAAVKITGSYHASFWKGNHLSCGDGVDNNTYGIHLTAATLNAVSFEDNEFLRVKSSGSGGFCYRIENDCVLTTNEPVSIDRVWRNVTAPKILDVETGGNHDDIWNGLRVDTLQVDRVYTISTDNVITVKAPARQGILSVVRQGSLATLSGSLMYQVDAGGAAVLSMAAGTNFNISTGVLTGTTGSNTTVSAHTDGLLYIENRDSSGVYRVKFFDVSAF